jgi:hypothetical protein
VAVRVFSNLEAMEGVIPEMVFEHLPAPATLQQGKKNIENQFRYALLTTDEKSMSMSFASFRMAFAVLSVSTNLRDSLQDPGLRIFAPGALAVPSVVSYAQNFGVRGIPWLGHYGW